MEGRAEIKAQLENLTLLKKGDVNIPPASKLYRAPPPGGRGVLNPPGLPLWLGQSNPRTRTASPWPGLPWPSQAATNPPRFKGIKRTRALNIFPAH